MPKTYKLLEVKNLNTSFKIDAGRVLAVNGVSFELEKGKILGIVGESGSGKSVTAYSIMGILDKNGKVDSGKIIYNGTDLLKLSPKEMREIRGNKISIIFQDAMVSLNPTWSIGNQLREAILTHAKNPVDEVIYPIENEIRSDKQRLASMEKGMAHHPDDMELKKDYEFVKEKLQKDLANFSVTKAKAVKELKANEKAKKKEYAARRPELWKAVWKAFGSYIKNFFKLNPKPDPTYIWDNKRNRQFMTDCQTMDKDVTNNEIALKEAEDAYKKATHDLSRAIFDRQKMEVIKELKQLVKTAKKHLKGSRKVLKVSKRYSKRYHKHQQKFERKLTRQYIHKPRHERYVAFKDARKARHNFYWDCKSAYRETRYSANKKALNMLIEVGITEPEKRLKQYPFELSGGMLQRCMIALALVTRPDILIADEPTTALDVTIQAQILELLKKLQKEYGMAIIIITHDLGVVAQICDEVDIMYAGRIVERGDVRDIFYNPQHEYTRGLLNSMPKLNSKKGRLEPIAGNPVDLFCLPQGCAFSSRCKNCMNICIEKYPEEVEFAKGHSASCWAMVKKLHEEKKIDITGKPTGKPLVYNGAIIHNPVKKKRGKKGKVQEVNKDFDFAKTIELHEANKHHKDGNLGN